MRSMSLRVAAAIGVFGSLVLLAAPLQAQAQSWPQRPVRFVIPFGPGAGADIGARLIQERLQKRWGQPVVIDNRPGGDSIIAIQAVLSANDDHTFLWGPSGNFIVHPFQYKKLPYDPNDIVPVARFSSTILGIGVPATMKVKTVAELVKLARAEQGKFNSAAVPGITELALDYFMHNAKVTTQKVPYKDIVQAVNDLAEDRLQIYSASYAILRPHREGNRITVLAQFGRERAPSLPDIPTGIEAGFPELEMDGNVGLFASKAPSTALVERIGADIVAVANDKSVDDRLNATAQTPARGGAKEFAKSIDEQRAHIAKIVKTLGIQPTR
jgi:tripartite-type tricarboxylate transporter receptor subunit TctC